MSLVSDIGGCYGLYIGIVGWSAPLSWLHPHSCAHRMGTDDDYLYKMKMIFQVGSDQLKIYIFFFLAGFPLKLKKALNKKTWIR